VHDAATPLATIVIEWENIQLSEADRCRAMLTELARQIDAFPAAPADGVRDFEILVIFDDGKITADGVRSFVAGCLPDVPTRAALRFLAGSGRGYYEQKNLGAREARGRFVVFLDSDVIPESGWLSRLLGSFADPQVEVVCGNCFLDTGDLVSKSLALAWFFPLRDGREVLARQESFFANNVAFRRDVALRYPFVPLEGSSRGACRLLARRLTADGCGLFVNTAARVSHPAPNGLRHLLLRGLAQGRDNLLFDRTLGRGGAVESAGRAVRMQVRAWKRILRHRRSVNLGVLAVPAALAIASLYYGCYAVGDAATRLCPGWAGRHLRV
jgi:glycosyltransferase involved in cell wall biosynthesis